MRTRLGLIAGASAASVAATYVCQRESFADKHHQQHTRNHHLHMLLRQVAARADPLLSDPPSLLHRFGSRWRKYATEAETTDMQQKRGELIKTLHAMGSKELSEECVVGLARVVGEVERCVNKVRAQASRRASEVPWADVMGDAQLVPACGGPPIPHRDALGGRLVLVYFTAGWCGPCRRFSPKLLHLYSYLKGKGDADGARGGESDGEAAFEVMMVSWDGSEEARRAYANAMRMPWLALPLAADELASELSLRYNVKHIPTLVVLELDAESNEARVLSVEGREELELAAAGEPAAEW
eukprot:CAMPEP_0119325026 /NCGR_PEP_ID=MMETSP1333-20130426/64798_1 /TAXON_ID=418940 /ORGANISM="Scyphosphaera apsteinii, Strain RCC1455" /LENGTH=297 /DNA_ID=CAMNT_0007332889 /DNA_START=75 /DNA_END=965 /DNA_ORIENTATION=+